MSAGPARGAGARPGGGDGARDGQGARAGAGAAHAAGHAFPDGPVLALEASSLEPSVALLGPGGERLGSWRQPAGVRGTAGLAQAAGALLERHGVPAAALGGVCVGIGPGSYTGVRAAIALARGLVFAARRPLVGVPSVAAAAAALLREHEDARCVVVLLDARRGQLYRADYERGAAQAGSRRGPASVGAPASSPDPASRPGAVPPGDVALVERAGPHLVATDAVTDVALETVAPADGPRVRREGDLIVVFEPRPDAYDVGRLGCPRAAAGGDDPAIVLPLYLKRSHAEIALEERR